MAEGEAAAEAAPVEEKKKGGMKGLIIKIIPLLLIAFVYVWRRGALEWK